MKFLLIWGYVLPIFTERVAQCTKGCLPEPMCPYIIPLTTKKQVSVPLFKNGSSASAAMSSQLPPGWEAITAVSEQQIFLTLH
jgi:hypothetical protein